jgi:hypothetical protein
MRERVWMLRSLPSRDPSSQGCLYLNEMYTASVTKEADITKIMITASISSAYH